MSIYAEGKYKASLKKLSGSTQVRFNPKNAVNQPFPVTGSARNCTVETVPRGGGRKPFIVVRDHSGGEVLRLDGRVQNIRYELENLVGKRLSSISWRPDEFGCLVTLRLAQEKREKGTPIGRIFFDTETTGLDPWSDEILQLAIVDGGGKVLWNRMYKPANTTSWPDAEAVNHISPSMVANMPTLEEDMPQIQAIFDRAEEVRGWNTSFDLAFLAEAGLRMHVSKAYDTMAEYGTKFHHSRWCKLSVAARECSYTFTQHDALADALATRHIQQSVDAGTTGAVYAASNQLVNRSHLGPGFEHNAQRSILDVHVPSDDKPKEEKKPESTPATPAEGCGCGFIIIVIICICIIAANTH